MSFRISGISKRWGTFPSGAFWNAVLSVVRIVARIMQPPCQIRDTSARSTPQFSSAEAREIRSYPCAYAERTLARSAFSSNASNAFESVGTVVPTRFSETFESFVRRPRSDETFRANTASAIDGTATPRSRASTTVHFPVHFCPARSSTMSTRWFPVSRSSFVRRTETEISNR